MHHRFIYKLRHSLVTAWTLHATHNIQPGPVVKRTHPWTHYLPTGFDNLPAATAHTNTRLRYATKPSMDALPANRTWQPPCSHGTYQHETITSRSRQLLMMGTWLPETCWATIRREIKNTRIVHYLKGISILYRFSLGRWNSEWWVEISCQSHRKFRHSFGQKKLECKEHLKDQDINGGGLK